MRGHKHNRKIQDSPGCLFVGGLLGQQQPDSGGGEEAAAAVLFGSCLTRAAPFSNRRGLQTSM